MKRIVIVGAGIGGLTAGAALAKAGLDVTLLEAHVYPGGSAGTFIHQGYRFDAGATLAAGFYPKGPMDRLGERLGGVNWPVHPLATSMLVHLSDGSIVQRVGDASRWEERLRIFGPSSLAFWAWQEKTADLLWNLALTDLPWPIQGPSELFHWLQGGPRFLAKSYRNLQPSLLLDAFSPLARRVPTDNSRLQEFLDGQLLISAQTTSASANALYSAAALDLPRRGPVYVRGGIGGIAQTLAEVFERHGGKLRYRKQVVRINLEAGSPKSVVTRNGETFPADMVIGNLTPDSLQHLLHPKGPKAAGGQSSHPSDGWGAVTLYAGIDAAVVPTEFPLHHQILRLGGMGEAASVFLSLSPGEDPGRAPEGKRAMTLSTHTKPGPWWDIHRKDPSSYEEMKVQYSQEMLSAGERVLPGLRNAVHLTLTGTPISFERFTRRPSGWVGGYPQTSLFRSRGPRVARGVWMVGDSIFPGQSIPAVALGGLRVAQQVLRSSQNQVSQSRFGQEIGKTNPGTPRRSVG